MKIVAKSNFCLDDFSEYFIAENVVLGWGREIVKLLRDNMGDNDSAYPELVDDDYELYIWEP